MTIKLFYDATHFSTFLILEGPTGPNSNRGNLLLVGSVRTGSAYIYSCMHAIFFSMHGNVLS